MATHKPTRRENYRGRSTERHQKNNDLAQQVLGIVCSNGGKMSRHQLTTCIMSYRWWGNMPAPNQEKKIAKIISDMQGILFTLDTDREDPEIQAYTVLELCPEHCTKAGCQAPICANLHLCKFYVLGSCKFGERCTYGHGLRNQRNYALLASNCLDKLEDDHIRYLLKQSKSKTSLPPICKFYNVGKGCRAGDDGLKCPWLHVCKHYILGSCSFGAKCRRSHNIFDMQPKRVLEKYGIDVKRSPKAVLQELRDHFGEAQDDDASSTASASSSSSTATGLSDSVSTTGKSPKRFPASNAALTRHTPAVDTEEICTFALRGKCNYGATCNKHHVQNPYRWEYCLTGDTQRWLAVASAANEKVELSFSDPMQDSATVMNPLADGRNLEIIVDFDALTGRVDDIVCQFRRLSTMSYVKAAPTHLYTTKWQWYWLDDDNVWKKYGKEGRQLAHSSYGKGIITSDITSRDIEESYLQYDASAATEMSFQTLANRYLLDVRTMTQKNVVYGTQRKVRRRPEFVVKKQLTSDEDYGRMSTVSGRSLGQASSASSMSVIDQPKHWSVGLSEDEENFKLVEIVRSGSTLAEYFKIEKSFYESMSRVSCPIKSIIRIQNSELWEKYSRNKSWKEKKGGIEQEERLLFHGTDKKYLGAICQQGFDWRLSGSSVGSAYGKGTYFAFTATLSNAYTPTKTMFVVRVLVGKSGLGKSSYVKPPPIDPAKPLGPLYDTCVDRLKDPRMVIVFEQERSYPEYIIQYDDTASRS